MSRRTATVAALAFCALAAAGCHRDGVVLTVHTTNLVADQLRLTASFDGQAVTHLRPDPAPSSPLAFPQDLFADFGDRAVDVTFTVEALSAGHVVATTQLPKLHVPAGQVVRADAELDGPAVSPPPTQMPDLGPARPSYASFVLADQPIAYYRLNEPAGATIAIDATGHGLNGSYGAQVTRGAPGLLTSESDGAATFNGGNWSLDGIVQVPRSGLLEPSSALTIEMWLRPLTNNADGTIALAYGDSLNVTHQAPYGVLFYANALSTLLYTSAGGVGAPDFLTVTRPAPQRTYHFVETYDGVNVKLYVNGVLEAQKPATGTVAGYGLSGLGIGGNIINFGADVLFAGTIDELAIYGVALTPQRVLAHFTAGSAKP